MSTVPPCPMDCPCMGTGMLRARGPAYHAMIPGHPLHIPCPWGRIRELEAERGRLKADLDDPEEGLRVKHRGLAAAYAAGVEKESALRREVATLRNGIIAALGEAQTQGEAGMDNYGLRAVEKLLRATVAGPAGAGDGRGGDPHPQGGGPEVLSSAGGTRSGSEPPPQSPAPVSGDLRTTYDRFQHLDRLLSDPDWVSGSPVAATLRDLWLAVRAEVESRRGAQAPVPPGERGGAQEG